MSLRSRHKVNVIMHLRKSGCSAAVPSIRSGAFTRAFCVKVGGLEARAGRKNSRYRLPLASIGRAKQKGKRGVGVPNWQKGNLSAGKVAPADKSALKVG